MFEKIRDFRNVVRELNEVLATAHPLLSQHLVHPAQRQAVIANQKILVTSKENCTRCRSALDNSSQCPRHKPTRNSLPHLRPPHGTTHKHYSNWMDQYGDLRLSDLKHSVIKLPSSSISRP
jgi:hypothetical protein